MYAVDCKQSCFTALEEKYMKPKTRTKNAKNTRNSNSSLPEVIRMRNAKQPTIWNTGGG